MGQAGSSGAPGGGEGGKKAPEKKKYEPPPPTQLGKRKKRKKGGLDNASKLPEGKFVRGRKKRSGSAFVVPRARSLGCTQ